MVHILKKHRVFILLIFLYLLSRFSFLTEIPIFNDESTYIRYGLHQIMEQESHPYSLLIGKEPLMPYLYGLVSLIFDNPLFGARTVSVGVGLLSIIGLYIIGIFIRSKSLGLIVVLLYICSPFFYLFDRLALMDNAVVMISIWSFLLTIALNRTFHFRYIILLGLVLGIGLWMKASVLFYVWLPLLYFIFLFLTSSDNRKTRFYQVHLMIIPVIIAWIISLPMIIHPFYQEYQTLMKQYTYPFVSLFQFSISIWWNNAVNSFVWLFWYSTPPIVILSFIGIAQDIRTKNVRVVLFWFIVPLMYIILFAKLLTSRHVLILGIPIIIFAGMYLESLLQNSRMRAYVILGTVILWSGVYIMLSLFRPIDLLNFSLRTIKNDLNQYYVGSASGHGIAEAVAFLKDRSLERNIVLLVRNDHGNPEDAIYAYLYYHPNITIIPVPPLAENLQEVLLQMPQTGEYYYISRGLYAQGVEKIQIGQKRFYHPNQRDFVGVYRVAGMKFD